MLANSKHLSVERDVRSKLGQLPATLKQQYAMIYQDILESEPSTATIAQRVFSWLLAAQRALTIEEFVAAVALDSDGYYHDDLDVSRLLDICHNLIVVISTDDKSSSQSFQVAHLSVKEYLLETSEFSTERIHTLVTLRCLQAFDPRCLVQRAFIPRRQLTKDIMRRYTIYLFEHAQRSELALLLSPHAIVMREFLFDSSLGPTIMLQEWIRNIENLYEDYIQLKDSEDSPLLQSMRSYKNEFTDNGAYYMCRYGLLSVFELIGARDKLLQKMIPNTSTSLIYTVISFGKLAVAQWLLEKGVTVADEITYGYTPLYVAVEMGEVAIVNLLLKHGADPLHGVDKDYSLTPWHMVFKTRHLETFQSLLDTIDRTYEKSPERYRDIVLNWKNEALFDAMLESWTAAASILISRGANIFSKTTRQENYDFPDEYRHSTILQVAVAFAELTTIQTLLEAAEHKGTVRDSSCTDKWMNALDHLGRSTLHYLMDRDMTMSHDNEAIMGLLIEHGVNSDMSDFSGLTALHVAASIGSLSILQDLQKRGLDLGARAHDGTTVLHIAAGGRLSSPSLVQYLVEEGLGPLDRDHEGKTTLHYAVASCNTVALGALIDALRRTSYSASLHNHSPLIFSVSASNEKFVNKEIYNLQTVIDCTDSLGNTLLHAIGRGLKVDHGNFHDGDAESGQRRIQLKDITHLLLDLGLDVNKLNTAGQTPVSSLLSRSYRNVFTATEILLTRGADARIPDWNGGTPLHVAANDGSIEAVKHLLQAGVDIEAKDCNMSTPLHVASDSHITRLLLQNKANPGSKDANGATPLHYACKDIFIGDKIMMLAKANADVNAVDKTGSTPLHWAAEVGENRAIKTLLKLTADPNVLNFNGETAMEVAARHASTITEKDLSFRDFLRTWHQLYHASEKQNKGTNIRPREPTLTRSRSLVFRTDHTWGDFSHVRCEEIAHGNGELFTRSSPCSSTLRCDDAVAIAEKHVRDLYPYDP